jgi:hypothetical protein
VSTPTTSTPTTSRLVRTAVAASGGDPLAEAVELTRRLKLPHIRRHLVELVPTARAQRWDHAELVRVLLAEEAAGRDATNLRTRRQRAGFPAGKTLHDWDAAASCIPRPTQDALTSLEWVGRRENVCICGPSGTGKSHFCEALGQAAVEAGMTVAWFTIEDLGALVRSHRADDSITRALARLIRTDLIIVDLCRPPDYADMAVASVAVHGFPADEVGIIPTGCHLHDQAWPAHMSRPSQPRTTCVPTSRSHRRLVRYSRPPASRPESPCRY